MPEMSENFNAGSTARNLLRQCRHGVLSTQSLDVEGYPFGSAVPYVLDFDHIPLILISRLAEHSRNLLANPKTALTLIESGNTDVQQSARLCLLTQAEIVKGDKAAQERYFRYFPRTRFFAGSLDFFFCRLKPIKARLIAGFGKAAWLDLEGLLPALFLSETDENQLLALMNGARRKEFLERMSVHSAMIAAEPESLRAVGVDSEGLDYVFREIHGRLNFKTALSAADDFWTVLKAAIQ
jgi:putative heme iron utilization protein